ncbi:MAG TPA: hypothetical protein PLU10_11115 [Chitinophagaceae bacterium]|nr:hypothetical protein [Chitinophagaceae bacterium]
MIKRWFIFLALLFSSQLLQASDSLVWLKSIRIPDARFMSTDPLGNIYVVTSSNQLIRFNADGDSNAAFHEIRKGHITQVDATNPMRVLVFFSDFGQIAILDKQLSLKSVLKLPALGFLNVPCIANSADGGIWIFDPIVGSLVKIDESPSVLFTTNLRNVLDEPLNPQYMIEQERQLFVVDSTQGIKQFDLYGFFKQSFPFLTNEVQWINQQLIYFKSPYLYSYQVRQFTDQKIELPNASTIFQVRTERNRVFILRENQLEIYSL